MIVPLVAVHTQAVNYYPGKKDAQYTSPNGQREAPDPTPILLAGVICPLQFRNRLIENKLRHHLIP